MFLTTRLHVKILKPKIGMRADLHTFLLMHRYVLIHSFENSYRMTKSRE